VALVVMLAGSTGARILNRAVAFSAWPMKATACVPMHLTPVWVHIFRNKQYRIKTA
jgi:hypothetical protein